MIKRRYLGGKPIAFQVYHLLTGKVAVHLGFDEKVKLQLSLSLFIGENFWVIDPREGKKKGKFFSIPIYHS